MITLIVLCIATLFLAYSNGANDNFKGVATFFGSGTTTYKAAITWATISTFAGSITWLLLAETLLKNFSGRGLVPNKLAASPQLVLAIKTFDVKFGMLSRNGATKIESSF